MSQAPGVFASFFGPDPLNLLGVVLLTSLGTWGLPQMVQKFYAIKDEKAIDTGMVISTVFAVFVAGGCYFLGGFGRLFSDQVDLAAGGYDSIIPTMLSGLPDLLIAVVVILVLSASMSTLSSLVLASSSTLTLDFLKDNIIKDMSEKRQVFIMRCLIVVFIAISVVLAMVQYHSNVTFIAQLMGVSWGALAGAFLAPFLFGLYWKRATKAACWVSFLFSTVVMLANIFVRSSFPALLQLPHQRGRVLHDRRADPGPRGLSAHPQPRTKSWWTTPSPAMTKRCWSGRPRPWGTGCKSSLFSSLFSKAKTCGMLQPAPAGLAPFSS